MKLWCMSKTFSAKMTEEERNAKLSSVEVTGPSSEFSFATTP